MSDERVVMVVDPGKTVGYAIWDLEAEDFWFGASAIGQRDIFDFLDQSKVFLEAQDEGAVRVVCERFVIGPQTLRKARYTEPIGVIWALRWLCHREGHEFEFSHAGAAMRFATDDRLKKLDWWQPGRGHANDALRHLVIHLVERGVQTIIDRVR